MDGIQSGVFWIAFQYAEILAILLVICQLKLEVTNANGECHELLLNVEKATKKDIL